MPAYVLRDTDDEYITASDFEPNRCYLCGAELGTDDVGTCKECEDCQ